MGGFPSTAYARYDTDPASRSTAQLRLRPDREPQANQGSATTTPTATPDGQR
jgi:hypothetical protein